LFRISLDDTAAELRNLFESAFQRRAGDPLAAIALAGKEAGDPPVGKRRIGRNVGALVVDKGNLLGRAELAPSDALCAMED
jgi:hypothetical protein